jgi:hypothetical protein
MVDNPVNMRIWTLTTEIKARTIQAGYHALFWDDI